jgi:peroxiredoxin
MTSLESESPSMTSTEIVPLSPGIPAPDFTLTDILTGNLVQLSGLGGRGTILDFWSVECPWSRHYDDYFLERQPQWAGEGIELIMIDSNTNESMDEIHDMADAYNMAGPILHDPGAKVADLYGAVTTPHIFVVDSSGLLVYQGAIDDRSFRNPNPAHNYLDDAISALLAGQPLSPSETLAYGCAIVRYAG